VVEKSFPVPSHSEGRNVSEGEKAGEKVGEKSKHLEILDQQQPMHLALQYAELGETVKLQRR